MIGGHMGRVLWVDLASGKIWSESPDEAIYRDFLGGYGFGARLIYPRQPAGGDPLGAEAILGFNTGVLVGSPAITPNRWTVTGKSPLTGGWGDANCGGYWGPMLKAAGYDAVYVVGIAERPVYLWIDEGQAELRDAADLWGRDALETEGILRERHAKAQAAVIGPAAERLSCISGVVNDFGRVAARSGLGAVMGSKRLKAIVARGSKPYPAADPARANEVRKRALAEMGKNPRVKYFTKYGTINHTASSAFSGDSPVKNWAGIGLEDFPQAEIISDDNMIALEYKGYGCWKCNIACGGHYRTDDPDFATASTHKPEYETSAMFGNNLLNENIHSILKANDLCNRYGLDTISAGSTIAFAVDCYQHGLLTRADTDGLELRWGDPHAIVALLHKMGRREGIGDLLADGTAKAAARIGKGAEQLAVHIGGQEPPAHDPRFAPSWGLIYAADATPGRHTQLAAYLLETGSQLPGLDLGELEKYTYTGKGEINALLNNLGQAMFSAGVCFFALSRVDFGHWPAIISAVTGLDYTVERLAECGARSAAVRTMFSVREGASPLQYHVAPRAYGRPPLKSGPLADIDVDVETMRREYFAARGWDPETALPRPETLAKLGIDDLPLPVAVR